MNILLSMLILLFGLSGCAVQNKYKFLDWAKLEGHQGQKYQINAIDLLLRQDIKTICQFSPYTFALNHQDNLYEVILKKSNLLPVGEGYFLFAYFDENEQLLGSENIPANTGTINATNTFDSDYTCIPISDAQISVNNFDKFIKFGII